MNNPFGTLRNAESMGERMGRIRKFLTCALTHQFAKQTQPA